MNNAQKELRETKNLWNVKVAIQGAKSATKKIIRNAWFVKNYYCIKATASTLAHLAILQTFNKPIASHWTT